MPRRVKMEDSDEEDDGHMPDWKRKKNLEKLQKLKDERESDAKHNEKMIAPYLRQKQMAEEAKLAAEVHQVKVSRTDHRFKEIREELTRRSRRKKEEDIIEEYYVDAYRMVAVQLHGTHTDLKNIIQQSGMKLNMTDMNPGEPNDETFVKQAKYHMKKYNYETALKYVYVALEYNPESLNAHFTAAKVHMLLGNWTEAMRSAEQVLMMDKKFLKAYIIKAEALFQICQFEHALLIFHRGQVLAPDNDEIRLGIQKCHKTIKDALRNGNVFHADGTETLFLILRKTTELRSSEIGRYKYQGKGSNSGNVVGLHQILTMLKTKKQDEGEDCISKDHKKPASAQDSKDDRSKVGKLDLKATFGKLAAKHAPPKDEEDMKKEANEKATRPDARVTKENEEETEKEVKKTVRIKLPDEESGTSSDDKRSADEIFNNVVNKVEESQIIRDEPLQLKMPVPESSTGEITSKTPGKHDKPTSTGRPQLMSVNEDNIETLVGSANIANPHTDGNEEEKITFKDEKADRAAAKNLATTFANMKKIASTHKFIDLTRKKQKKKKMKEVKEGATEVRVMAQKAAKDMKKQQTKKRQKRAVEQDRLFEDKVYLAVLAKGINIKKNKWAQEDGRDPQETEDLETKIADKANEALMYLTSREDFWDQIDAGKHGGIKNGGCMFGGKVCESLRFQM